MSDESAVPQGDQIIDAAPVASAAPDRVLELNFVPNWARRAPGSLFDGHLERRGGGDGGGDRAGYGGRDRPERRTDDRRDQRRPSRERDQRRDGRARPPSGGGAPAARPSAGPVAAGRPSVDRRGPPSTRPRDSRPPDRRGRQDYAPQLPVDCRFLPDQKALASMVRQIAQLRRAFPLLDLAAIFTSKPETCLLRLDIWADARDAVLYQCKTCGMVAMDRVSLVGHMTKSHMDEFFTKEEIVSEAPAGQFVCVAKCGLSGTLLGPPNHHSFASKVQELHATRFPHMSLEQYRSRIETVRDQAAIDQWKEESRKKVVYKLKGVENAEAMGWVAAEAHMAREIAPAFIQQAKRAAMSVGLCRQLEDRGLLRLAEEAWGRECRFPGNLVFALRGAFRGKHLRVFRARKMEFVTAIEPVPLDSDHVVEPIRAVLVFLKDHPGCKREQLVEALRPGKAADSPEVAEVLSPLAWLVEKGHIIEFFDGSMAVPLGNNAVTQKQAAPAAAAAPAPVPELPPESTTEQAAPA
jgi:hypothetical protein